MDSTGESRGDGAKYQACSKGISRAKSITCWSSYKTNEKTTDLRLATVLEVISNNDRRILSFQIEGSSEGILYSRSSKSNDIRVGNLCLTQVKILLD